MGAKRRRVGRGPRFFPGAPGFSFREKVVMVHPAWVATYCTILRCRRLGRLWRCQVCGGRAHRRCRGDVNRPEGFAAFVKSNKFSW